MCTVNSGGLPCFRLHLGDLVYLPVLVVGGPLAHLLAVFEIARAHFCPVFAEPLPVSCRHSVDGLAFCPDRSTFVVVDVLFCLGSRRWHRVDSSLLAPVSQFGLQLRSPCIEARPRIRYFVAS